jgi:hypothetical protein
VNTPPCVKNIKLFSSSLTLLKKATSFFHGNFYYFRLSYVGKARSLPLKLAASNEGYGDARLKNWRGQTRQLFSGTSATKEIRFSAVDGFYDDVDTSTTKFLECGLQNLKKKNSFLRLSYDQNY